MADTIIRLKVESTEYENRLKRAVQGMQQLEKHVREMGAGFEVAEKADLDFVRALGQMETKATSSTGKLAELKSAFVELSVQYKNLSDAEKKGEFGVALNKSLGQLKVRIDDLGSQIKEANTDINGIGGILDAVASKIGIPTELFSKMGVAVAAVGAALKVATDALKQNEQFMDEWGATVESAQGLYDGFLNALNTGDFSGFFRSMDDIVLAARAAYDAMDELGTFNAFNQIQKEVAKTNFTQAVADFREGKVSREDAQAAAEALKQELEAQADKEKEAYEAAVAKLAATRGVNAEMLLKALSGDYGSYQDLKALPLSNVTEEWNGSWSGTKNMRKVYSPANEQEALGQMLRTLSDDELNAIQALGAQAQRTATEVAQIDRQMVRLLGTSKKTGEIVKADDVLPEGSIAAIKQRISELNKSLEMAGDQTTRDRIKAQINDLRAELKEMTDSPLSGQNSQVIPLSVELLDTSTEQLTEEVNVLREKLGMQPIEIGITTNGKGGSTVDTAKQTEQAWSAAADAIQSISGALQQIEDPSAKVAGIVMQAVANIALGFATASAQAAAGGPVAWIAATLSGLATMVSTIAAIKNATKFADGGMVGGNSYSGDNIVARLNSGEGVLTAAGVRNAQAMASNTNPMGGMQLEALISGESLRLVLANNASRRGGNRSQYAITKFG